MQANWTSALFGFLIFAFLFFITVRGDLARLLGIFGLAGGPAAMPGFGNVTGPGTALLPSLGAGGPFGQLPDITALAPLGSVR